MKTRMWSILMAAAGCGALALRLIHLAQLRDTPLLAVLIGDGQQYDAWAQQIAAGQWMGSEVFYQTPLYPYFLAIVFKIVGHNLLVVRVLQSVSGSLSCVLLGLAGSRFFSPKAGFVAAALLSVYPPAIFFDGLIQKSSLDLLLIALLLALLAGFYRRPHWKWIVAAGAALGAFMLNRENARVLYPIIAGWLLMAFRSRPFIRRMAWTALLTASCAAVVLPVGLRNYHVGGEFLISTSQFGPNFYIGNHPDASGGYEELIHGHGNASYEQADAARLAANALGRSLSPGEISAYWFSRSVAYIRCKPGDWLGLLGRKFLLTLSAREAVDTESIEVYAEYSGVLRLLLWFDFGIVLPLGIFGIWWTRDHWRQLWLLYAALIALTLSVALFYVLARYRYPIVPILILFAAAAICFIPKARFDRPAEWVPGLVLAALVAVACRIPVKLAHDETYYNLGSRLLDVGRPAEALPLLRKAVDSSPDFASACFELGEALNSTGEKEAAAGQYEAAIRLRPDYAEAHNALALALREAGHPEEALEHFNQAVQSEPEFAEAHSNLGLALCEAGRRQEGIAHFRESIRLKPDDAMTHNNLAGALQQEGRFQEAIEHYETALRINPGYPEAHANLALVLSQVGDFDAALKQQQEAVRLQPDNFGIQINFGGLLLAHGRIKEAIDHYGRAANLAPDSVEAHFLLGEAYAQDGQVNQAVASFEKALSLAREAGRVDAQRQIAVSLRECRKRMTGPTLR
jgi:tetratricopeptide (TPR) repeat protein